MLCPLCGRPISNERNLRAHLSAESGHARSDDELEQLCQQAYVPPMATTPDDDFLSCALKQLADFKGLPKFAFEHRLDALLAPFIAQVLSTRLGGNYELVAPEFPLRRPDDRERRSTNADYLLFRDHDDPAQRAWCLFELKTDDKCVRREQFQLYAHAQARGMFELVAELDTWRMDNVGSGWQYDRLAELVGDDDLDAPIEVVYLAPGPAPDYYWDCDEGNGHLASMRHWIRFVELQPRDVTRFPDVWERFLAFVVPHLQ